MTRHYLLSEEELVEHAHGDFSTSYGTSMALELLQYRRLYGPLGCEWLSDEPMVAPSSAVDSANAGWHITTKFDGSWGYAYTCSHQGVLMATGWVRSDDEEVARRIGLEIGKKALNEATSTKILTAPKL
jgi:hypothetical protein